MYTKASRYIVALVLLPILAPQIQCAPPLAIPFQAVLKTPSGQAITNPSQSVTLALYTVAAGGAPVYTETKSVAVANGLCVTTIGDGTPAAWAALPFNVPYWVGVTVGADPEMTPRIPLSSTPYALYANSVPWANVTGAPTNLPPSGAAGGDLVGTYPNPTIGTSKVDAANIAAGAVGNSELAAGAVTDAKVNDVSYAKITGAPTTMPPSGAAGGDLTGTYPGPSIAAGAVTSTNLAYDINSLNRVSDGVLQFFDLTWVDQISTSSNTTGSMDAWQSFTPAFTGYIKRLMFAVGSTGASSYTTTLRLYSGEGIGGTLLHTQTITINPTLGQQSFTLSTPRYMISGSKYTWFLATAPNSQIRYSTVNTYSGGRADLNANYDYYFTTFVSPTIDNNELNVDTYTTFDNGIYSTSALTNGIYAITTNPGSAAVYGYTNASGAYAGRFSGDVRIAGDCTVTGTLTKGAGAFRIDHPLDPANKTLSHSFVESPDMMNIYNGNVKTDSKGRAVVKLPTWFSALNRDFRYQLTPIGTFADAIIESEVANNRFVIRTDKPGVKVSWQVTGIRNDAYAKAHRIPTEEMKSKEARGTYLFPEGFQKPKVASKP